MPKRMRESIPLVAFGPSRQIERELANQDAACKCHCKPKKTSFASFLFTSCSIHISEAQLSAFSR
jgi:hypothetical protein